MHVRLLVAVLLMLTLVACEDGGADGGSPTSATGGESTTTSVQPTTTASPEAESGPLVGLGELELVESTIPFLELEGPQWMPARVCPLSDVPPTDLQRPGPTTSTEFRKPNRYTTPRRRPQDGDRRESASVE